MTFELTMLRHAARAMNRTGLSLASAVEEARLCNESIWTIHSTTQREGSTENKLAESRKRCTLGGRRAWRTRGKIVDYVKHIFREHNQDEEHLANLGSERKLKIAIESVKNLVVLEIFPYDRGSLSFSNLTCGGDAVWRSVARHLGQLARCRNNLMFQTAMATITMCKSSLGQLLATEFDVDVKPCSSFSTFAHPLPFWFKSRWTSYLHRGLSQGGNRITVEVLFFLRMTWSCPVCGTDKQNYRRKCTARDCRHLGGPPSAWDNRRGTRNGSRTPASSASRRWTCPDCSNQIYAWRGYCHSCSRAVSSGGRGSSGGGSPARKPAQRATSGDLSVRKVAGRGRVSWPGGDDGGGSGSLEGFGCECCKPREGARRQAGRGHRRGPLAEEVGEAGAQGSDAVQQVYQGPPQSGDRGKVKSGHQAGGSAGGGDGSDAVANEAAEKVREVEPLQARRLAEVGCDGSVSHVSSSASCSSPLSPQQQWALGLSARRTFESSLRSGTTRCTPDSGGINGAQEMSAAARSSTIHRLRPASARLSAASLPACSLCAATWRLPVASRLAPCQMDQRYLRKGAIFAQDNSQRILRIRENGQWDGHSSRP